MARSPDYPPERGEIAAALTSARSRLSTVTAVLALAGGAWWLTAERMSGMDAGPGTDPGGFGWFVGVWVVMMAAMMLPSFTPTATVLAGLSQRLIRPATCIAGYLLVWAAAGVAAYGVFELGKSLIGGSLAWQAGGRWVAAAVVAAAAAYELTPLKRRSLAICRSPLRFMRDASPAPDALPGGFVLGVRAGGWCLASSWALMVALFALGVMSVTWMVLVAALVMVDKLLPWRRVAIASTVGVLLLLSVGIAATPGDVPGLVVPGSSAAPQAMKAMH